MEDYTVMEITYNQSKMFSSQVLSSFFHLIEARVSKSASVVYFTVVIKDKFLYEGGILLQNLKEIISFIFKSSTRMSRNKK